MGRLRRFDQFADFSKFTDQLRGSETTFVQLAVGHPEITHCCFDAGDVILHRTQFGLGSSCRSTRRPDWASLVIDLSPKRWCGIDMAAGAVRLIGPGREMHAASQGPRDTLSINIHRDTLARWAPVVADTLDADLAPDHDLLPSDLRTGWRSAQTVTTIAFEHELQNLSRFASQHARLFGERPPDTLRAAKTAPGQA